MKKLSIFRRSSISRTFCSKHQNSNDFYDFIINNLNKNRKHNDSNTKSNKSNLGNDSKFFKEKNYFKLKHNILSPKIKTDMQLLKLKEDFSPIELRQKYLSLAKLYHPDIIKNDKHV